MLKRRKTKIVKIGKIKIGTGCPIAIQSMAKVKTSFVKDVLKQINGLSDIGCDIIRLAIKDMDDAKAILKIKRNTNSALVADIHFDYKLALESIKNGIDKVRLNPGNIYKKEEVKEVVTACKDRKIPIRIGLNSGSLPNIKPHNKKKTDDVQRLVSAAFDYIKLLEDFHFFDIVVSLKSSDVLETVEAYKKLACICEYPFHLGITAAGPLTQGLIKSSLGLGILLFNGIGDTIRVSLTTEPKEEVYAAKYILQNLRLMGSNMLDLITCPTCGRCEVDLVNIVNSFEKHLGESKFKNVNSKKKPLKVALMGCVVNGPGEAKDADLGIAFGKKEGLFFKAGKAAYKVSPEAAVETIIKELKSA